MVQTNSTAYFDRFPRYTPDFHNSLDDEFLRLARSQGWSKKRIARERNAFLLAHYDLHLGEVERSKSLKDWQALCSELHVSPIPESITQCKKVTLLFSIPDLQADTDMIGSVDSSPCKFNRPHGQSTLEYESKGFQESAPACEIYNCIEEILSQGGSKEAGFDWYTAASDLGMMG